MDLSQKLRKLRLAQKMSQYDVAHELGISQSTYASWENNTIPRTKYLPQLSALFSCDIAELISDDTELIQTMPDQDKLEYLTELNSIKSEVITFLKNENRRLNELLIKTYGI